MQSRGLMFYALLLSVLLNLGVVGAAGYRAFTDRTAPGELADRLRLDPQQRQRWHSLEESFVRELDAGWKEIASHREKLVREVFSDKPDPTRIEAERARIAQIQVQQQQRVIEQFMREREILEPAQRQALVDLLLREEHAVPRERQLHGGQ